MFRRIICLVIIASMIMHCAARLGVLSYLYEKRHDIAFSAGLISEIPMTMCSHHYDFGTGLVLHDTGDEHKSHINFSLVKDITLILQNTSYSIAKAWMIFDDEKIEFVQTSYSSTYLLDIFRPPAFLS